MGRMRSRNPGLPREERERLGRKARALFLAIAAERSWLPMWDFDDGDFKECIVFAGNPGLKAPLTLCFSGDSISFWFEPGDTRWFSLEPQGQRGFRPALSAALEAQGDQTPSHSSPPGSRSAL